MHHHRTQHNRTQHNITRHNRTKQNRTEHNTTQLICSRDHGLFARSASDLLKGPWAIHPECERFAQGTSGDSPGVRAICSKFAQGTLGDSPGVRAICSRDLGRFARSASDLLKGPWVIRPECERFAQGMRAICSRDLEQMQRHDIIEAYHIRMSMLSTKTTRPNLQLIPTCTLLVLLSTNQSRLSTNNGTASCLLLKPMESSSLMFLFLSKLTSR